MGTALHFKNAVSSVQGTTFTDTHYLINDSFKYDKRYQSPSLARILIHEQAREGDSFGT